MGVQSKLRTALPNRMIGRVSRDESVIESCNWLKSVQNAIRRGERLLQIYSAGMYIVSAQPLDSIVSAREWLGSVSLLHVRRLLINPSLLLLLLPSVYIFGGLLFLVNFKAGVVCKITNKLNLCVREWTSPQAIAEAERLPKYRKRIAISCKLVQ